MQLQSYSSSEGRLAKMLKSIIFLYAADIQAKDLTIPTANFDTSLALILKIVFGIITLLSVIFVAVGGLKYTTSNGDPQGVASAKNTILAAVVGLIIGISAFTIVGFVAGRL